MFSGWGSAEGSVACPDGKPVEVVATTAWAVLRADSAPEEFVPATSPPAAAPVAAAAAGLWGSTHEDGSMISVKASVTVVKAVDDVGVCSKLLSVA